MIPRLLSSLILCSLLASCAKLGSLVGGGEKKDEPSPFGPTGVPPQLRAGTSGGDAATASPSGAVLPPGTSITPDDEILFIDPDDPDASLPELSTLLSSGPKRRSPWEESDTVAKQRAAREGKPLLVWFTDSKTSPMCKALNEELFSKPEFEEWASEKLIRLRVDSNVRDNPLVKDDSLSIGDAMTREVELSRYVDRLKKQYKVLGQPVIIMLNSSGSVIGTYRGYKRGDADFRWGQIKQAEAASTHAHQQWQAALAKKGYREWKDRHDRKVFAKLLAYSKGTLTLVEPDGTRSKTHEDKLGEADQDWIRDQKKLRNLN
jgi:thioredoxin-related protein